MSTPAYFKGRENVYTCPDCGGYTVTVDRDEGTTPAFLDCRARVGCKGMAASAWYPSGPRPGHIPPPAWEWYRPDAAETKRLKRKWFGAWEHVRAGGLLLRKITPPAGEVAP